MSKRAYIWYSPATDVTGKALVERLNAQGGTTKVPGPANAKVVIGWGAKTKDSVSIPKSMHVLNHPNKIRDNRNKYKTLQALRKSKLAVANFCTAKEVLAELKKASGAVKVPVVGRTNFHQSGKGFWLCLTQAQVKNAIDEGAQYFQDYLDIADEFRVHVFGGDVIYVQKKVKRKNMTEAFKEQHAEKITNAAKKAKKDLDTDTMDYILGRMAKGSPNPDMIVRSNMRGWKFSRVAKPKKELCTLAVAAVKAVGLDFGAVDCCLDTQGNAWVIEINSGPSLQGSTMDAYIAAFTSSINSLITGKKTAAKKTTGKAAVLRSTSDGPVGDKRKLMREISKIAALAEDVDDEEAAMLEGMLLKRTGRLGG